jgi:stalled ribosome rescue protein Dom34
MRPKYYSHGDNDAELRWFAPSGSSNHHQDRIMTSHLQAIVWIDHAQARVIKFDRDTSSIHVVHPEGGTPHLHHKANSVDDGHLPENQAYLHAVAQAMAGIDSVLVAGPANAKLELLKHIARHDPLLLEKVSGVQTVDHPTDGQLLDLARRHFRLSERGLASQA